MPTAHLPTVHVSVATHQVSVLMGVSPQLNGFEQVYSDDHQMSVAGPIFEGYPAMWPIL